MLRSKLFLGSLAMLAVGTAALAPAQETLVAPNEALAAYVAKADGAFTWREQRRYSSRGAEVIELHLESQTWQDVIWKHQLLVIRPRHVSDDGQALLIVGGGRWRDEYETEFDEAQLPEDAQLFVAIARVLRTPVVVLGQVPYQPLFGLSEDRLIAHTFERFLATNDAEWPLLLPMVKSVVRAMDASSSAHEREWGTPLDRFTVIGGSKRGWTTWLTAAVEARVTAIAPIVIDALNMERHFPHQVEAWGAPSVEIAPYTELGLDRVLASPEGAALRQIVDPFSYRDRLPQPKLIMLATNDEYFPLDSANLYFDGLPEPKRLLYLPNEGHSVRHYGAVVRGLRALHEAARGGAPLPQLGWEYVLPPGGESVLCVRAPQGRKVELWRAVSADRDLRDAQWQVAAVARGERARFVLPPPAAGYVALLAQVTFGRGRAAFELSTSLAVVASAAEPPYGTQPPSSAAVCEGVAATAAMSVR